MSEKIKKYMETATPIEWVEHSIGSAAAIAELQAYMLELILRHYDKPESRKRIDYLTHQLNIIQKDLNHLYTLKTEIEKTRHLAEKYYFRCKELEIEVEKLNKVINGDE